MFVGKTRFRKWTKTFFLWISQPWDPREEEQVQSGHVLWRVDPKRPLNEASGGHRQSFLGWGSAFSGEAFPRLCSIWASSLLCCVCNSLYERTFLGILHSSEYYRISSARHLLSSFLFPGLQFPTSSLVPQCFPGILPCLMAFLSHRVCKIATQFLHRVSSAEFIYMHFIKSVASRLLWHV